MVAIAIENTGGRRNCRKVLVADDERSIARLVQVILERAEYEVFCAYSADIIGVCTALSHLVLGD